MKVKVQFAGFYRSIGNPFLHICGILHNVIKNIFKWIFIQFFDTILLLQKCSYTRCKSDVFQGKKKIIVKKAI